MDEFGFIAEHLAKLAGAEALELKDDVALFSPPKAQQIVISTDTLVEAVHFTKGQFDADLAAKLIAVNVSDIIAKGAKPIGYTLSLALGKTIGEADLVEFVSGLAKAQQDYGLKLWGGDTTKTKGQTVLTLTIFGLIPTGKTVLRAGAKQGDLLCVSGTIGNAYLGLKCVQGKMPLALLKTRRWLQAYKTPKPPFALYEALRKYANAAIDISDGLIADAAHLARASNVAAEIYLTTIPLSSDTSGWVLCQDDNIAARVKLATGGDDYQLLFSISQKYLPKLLKQAEAFDIAITAIGKITRGSGVVCLDSKGKLIKIDRPGYTHF